MKSGAGQPMSRFFGGKEEGEGKKGVLATDGEEKVEMKSITGRGKKKQQPSVGGGNRREGGEGKGGKNGLYPTTMSPEKKGMMAAQKKRHLRTCTNKGEKRGGGAAIFYCKI